jgi:cytosine/adenosine deaminase-related metal-dependent hydrolase
VNGLIFSLVIRNAYLRELNGIYDIGISGDKIVKISEQIMEKGEKEIDAKQNFVSPGFIDSHTHMDKSLTGEGERLPKYNESSYVRDNSIIAGLEYYKNATIEEIKSQVIRHAYMQVANGTLYTRTHVDVDKIARTKAIKGVISAREELKDLIDIQIVAFAQSGFLPDPDSEPLVREAIDMGADIVGSLDPATCEYNIEKSLDLLFKIAKDYNVDIDDHVMDPGTLGIYSLKRFAQKTLENNYKRRVTASHSFSLADAPESWLDEAIPTFQESGLNFVTCYSSSPHTFPTKKLFKAGIPLGCGSDNIRDFWIAFGNGDMVQGALIETQRWDLTTNLDMDLIWKMITFEGAKVLGIEKDYGIQEGKTANLVILDALSPQWAIIQQAKKLYVIKNGKVIVKDGVILPEFKKY